MDFHIKAYVLIALKAWTINVIFVNMILIILNMIHIVKVAMEKINL